MVVGAEKLLGSLLYSTLYSKGLSWPALRGTHQAVQAVSTYPETLTCGRWPGSSRALLRESRPALSLQVPHSAPRRSLAVPQEGAS